MPHDEVSNSATDASGQIVQAGTITGGVHFHQPPAAAPSLPLRVGLVPQLAASFQERTTSDQLARTLDGGGTAILTSDRAQATVLSGMGGVGKTQLAADYAERTWAAGEVQLLAWVTATSREAVVSGYANVATRLTGQDHPDPEQGARTFLEWLAQAAVPWLVVLDDLQTPADILGLWPPSTSCGRTVVTTRRRDAALHGHQRQLVEVGVFSDREALTYLQAVLADQPALLADAEGLVQDLGRLPLALAQAGAYVRDRHLSCAEYRTRLAERRLANVVPDPAELPDEHKDTVAATWSLSVEQADRLEPRGVARPLLDIASVLDANGIPIEIFTAPAVLKLLTSSTGRDIDESDARDGLACLHRLSLITLNVASVSREVRVHALVQRATRDGWAEDVLGQLVRTAADATVEVWPAQDRNRLFGQVLRANADAIIHVGGEHLWRPDPHGVLFQTGQRLGDSGFLVEAKNYFHALREAATRYLGPDDPTTLSARHNLGIWLAESGDRASAIAEYEQLLADRIRVLGPGHRNTLVTRSQLASWQADIGALPNEAATLSQIVSDFTEVFGPDYPDTLIARNRLARSLLRTGQAAAKTELEELLADQLRVLGPDHWDTLQTRGDLGYALTITGDPAGAVVAHERLLVDLVRVLGPEHRSTLVERGNLAHYRYLAGDPAGALTTLEQLLTDQLRLLGPGHPDVEKIRRNIAHLRQNMSD